MRIVFLFYLVSLISIEGKKTKLMKAMISGALSVSLCTSSAFCVTALPDSEPIRTVRIIETKPEWFNVFRRIDYLEDVLFTKVDAAAMAAEMDRKAVAMAAEMDRKAAAMAAKMDQMTIEFRFYYIVTLILSLALTPSSVVYMFLSGIFSKTVPSAQDPN